jgi:hypothetical protein
MKTTQPISERQPLLLFVFVSELFTAADAAADDEDDAPPPAFMKTIGLFDELAFLASSAARSATSNVSPQCLHFLASAETNSAQNGHFFWLEEL